MTAISVAYWGSTATAKTSNALSWPRPAYFDFDMRSGGVKPELLANIVKHYRYPAPIQLFPSGVRRGKIQGWREIYDQFIQDYLNELRNDKTDTLIVDTATQMRVAVNNSYLEELQDTQTEEQIKRGGVRETLQQIEYGKPNGRIQAIIQAARTANKNLVLVHYEENEYQDKIVRDPRTGSDVKESVQTGRMVMAGFNKTESLVDMVIVTSLGGDPLVPVGVVLKAGLAMEMKDMRIEDPTYDAIVARLRMFRPEWS